MNPIDVMLSRWVVPVLKGAGFRRRGRLYTRVRPNGDYSSVHFWKQNVADGICFVVELGVDLRTSRQWMNRDVKKADPGGVLDFEPRRAGDEPGWWWQWKPLPPREFAVVPDSNYSVWAVDPPGDDAGGLLAGLLVSEYLPLVDRFDDLDWLEAECRRQVWGWPGVVACWGEGALAMVVGDRRDDPEVDVLAGRVAARWPGHDLGPWLATRMLRGDMTGRPEAGLPEAKGGRG